MRKLLIIVVLLVVVMMCGEAQAGPLLQWVGNDHWYQQFFFDPQGEDKLAWFEAQAFAESMGGYLATFHSIEENNWTHANVSVTFFEFLGGYQTSKDDEPAGNWAWITGEPWTFTNWGASEPNNGGPGDEDYLVFERDGRWNDLRSDVVRFREKGIIVEWDEFPGVIPEPSSLLLLGTGLAGLATLRRRKKP